MGKTIAREFGEVAEWRTLPRWISFRIAELIRRAEESDGDQREEAQKKATDLILRLWQMREKWPQGAPMSNLEEGLRRFGLSQAAPRPKVVLDDWASLIGELSALGDKDLEILLDAFTSQIDLEAEKRWMSEAGDQVSESERSAFEFFKARHDSLHASKSYRFGDCKDLFEMSATELRGWVKMRLVENNEKRRAAIKQATTRKRASPKKQDSDEDDD